MKNLTILTVFAISCLIPGLAFSQLSSDKLSQFSWLEGSWKRTDAKPGYEAFETWWKVSNKEYHGIGVTLKAGDTVFVEQLKLIQKQDELFYVATVSPQAGPVYFKIVASKEDGFTASNPNHDFPKEINYNLNENRIKATISGDGKSIDFHFKKSK